MTEPLRWLEFAREDLVLARAAIGEGISNQACFHAQQGVEKALKGFLRSKEKSVPRTHALVELLELCREIDSDFSGLEESCTTLDQYYIPTRYPDALPGVGAEGLPTEQDAGRAVEILSGALDWISGKVR